MKSGLSTRRLDLDEEWTLEFCRTDLLEHSGIRYLLGEVTELEKTKPEAKNCSSPILWELLKEEWKHILCPYLIWKVSTWKFVLFAKNFYIFFSPRETQTRELRFLWSISRICQLIPDEEQSKLMSILLGCTRTTRDQAPGTQCSCILY